MLNVTRIYLDRNFRGGLNIENYRGKIAEAAQIQEASLRYCTWPGDDESFDHGFSYPGLLTAEQRKTMSETPFGKDKPITQFTKEIERKLPV